MAQILTNDTMSAAGQRAKASSPSMLSTLGTPIGGPAMRLAECVLLTVVAVGLGLRFSPSDPLLQHSAFPWMGLLPLLCGLQHGFVAALLSGSVLALVVMLPQVITAEVAPSWLLGCFAMGLVAGQFRDRFAERLGRAEREARQRGIMLTSIQRQFELLQHSHEELRAFHAGAHLSLQDATDAAMQHLRAAMSAPEAVAQVLELFAAQGRVDGAALYLVRDGALMTEPSGKLGSAPVGGSSDAVMQLALKERRLVSVDRRERPVTDERAVLAAVPFVLPSGEVFAVLAIHDMPLVAFEPQHLRRLLTMAGCLAEPLHVRLSGEEPLAAAVEKIEIHLLAQASETRHTSETNSKAHSKGPKGSERGHRVNGAGTRSDAANQALTG